MITNNPRPPKLFVPATVGYASSLNVYSYFSTATHGLNVFDMSVAGAYQSIADLANISGVLEYLILAVDNNTGTAEKYGARVIMDGRIVYASRLVSLPANNESGLSLVGIMLWNDTDNEPYCSAQDDLVFEHNLKIEGYVSALTSVDMLVAYRYRITGPTGS